ncbi:MAG TPA: kelch repeat-containing protein, partial [Elusimicrobiales bacterium]|nr:kelch repeat-containing protein [Elusimicrobiales bacterium]
MISRKAFLLFISALALLRPHAQAALTARHSHTTTLLPDGNILITGGTLANGTRTGEVQIYNMSANTFDTWAGGGPLDRAPALDRSGEVDEVELPGLDQLRGRLVVEEQVLEDILR